MSKDPAFLFYPQDFITGTMFMSNEQIGIYLRLLCAQHQHGGLIDKSSFNAMVREDELLRSKFIETDDGFFNKRMMEEMKKRNNKSTNMSANAHVRWDKYKENHANAMQLHSKSNADVQKNDAIAMQTEDENEDVIVVKKNKRTTKFKKPTIEEVVLYCKETQSCVDGEHFWHFYEQSEWIKANGQPVLNWKSTIKTWEKRNNGKPNDTKRRMLN